MAVPTFNDYAGQLVSGGVKAENPTMPINGLEESPLTTNLKNVAGLTAKVKDVFARRNPAFTSPLERLVTKWSEPYGAGMEQVMFGYAPNKTMTGAGCFPTGVPSNINQTDYINFAFNVTINIPDRLFNTAVLTEGQAGALYANYMEAPIRSYSYLRHLALSYLISDICDGTRNIASNSQSDGNGSSVTYNMSNITGYAGRILDSGIAFGRPVRGSPTAAPSIDNALTIARALESAACDFGYVGTDYIKAGDSVPYFTEGQPWLVMERKTLNALDAAFVNGDPASNATAQIGPTTFRSYVSRFANVLETDAFADLPTNDTYTNKHLGAVLIDPYDAIIEDVKVPVDTESARCIGSRSTSFNTIYESIIAVSRMTNSYAVVFNNPDQA